MSIRVVARDHMKPECKEEAMVLLKEMVELTRKEEGCISYQYCQDKNDPDCFAMLECWESEEALKKHMGSEHFCRIIPEVQKMTAEPSRLEVYQELF